ncbi:MAG TPA: hypothetical protein VN203_22210, partial [Candidatus Acidoferrum sp.]|nr:hypothetical protein [Candidatus Acidoferrum sp.]
KPILDSIRQIHAMKIWLEVVTLVVPGLNDSDAELAQIASFLAGVSLDIPWHVTAFHGDYQMLSQRNTPAETLVRAATIGRRSGLRYVYAGNLAGRTGDLENTFCPGCGDTLVTRRGFRVLDCMVTSEGRCPSCLASIPGLWP